MELNDFLSNAAIHLKIAKLSDTLSDKLSDSLIPCLKT